MFDLCILTYSFFFLMIRRPPRSTLFPYRRSSDLERMAAAADRTGAKLVVVCDPNNPTGSLVERAEWDAFLDALPDRCAVVVDEAYVEYVDPARALGRERDVADGRPVILFRTFSKIFGLAGLRLGYAVVH